MTVDEVRLMQLNNQYLINKGGKLTVVRDLLGVQAQFMTNAVHSLRIRINDFDEATLPDGLVKNWTVRGTVHVFAEDDLALFKHCDNGASYRSDIWHGYTHYLTHEWTLTPERQKYFSHLILDATENSELTRDEMKSLCRENGMTEPEQDAMFNSWGGGIRDLCERGYMNYTVAEKKTYRLSPPFSPIAEDEAEPEMYRRYFTNLAPATVRDAAYFFHATQAQVKKQLDLLPVTSFKCTVDGKERMYYYIENGRACAESIPDCIFLAGFDQLMLAYLKTESLYLPPEHLRDIFNLAGIVMPPVLLHGRVAGKWKYKGGKLSVTCFDSLDGCDRKTVSDAASSLWADELKKIEYV